ncbi:MAG: hypothetical protein ACYTGJ_10005 [Planctomycetota bacterium]
MCVSTPFNSIGALAGFGPEGSGRFEGAQPPTSVARTSTPIAGIDRDSGGWKRFITGDLLQVRRPVIGRLLRLAAW